MQTANLPYGTILTYLFNDDNHTGMIFKKRSITRDSNWRYVLVDHTPGSEDLQRWNRGIPSGVEISEDQIVTIEPEGDRPIVSKYESKEDGLASFVELQANGGFRVYMKDTDADQVIPIFYLFGDKETAQVRAQNILGWF